MANALLSDDQLDQPEATYPLELAFCPECSLVQITETVPAEKLFADYVYFSSFSETMLAHARELTQRMVASRGLGARHLVVEIASNDGYLLQNYQAAGVPVLGIEPAQNIAAVAEREKGIRTLCEFFSQDLAQQVAAQGEQADVIHAHNVLAHVSDLNGFAAGIQTLLKSDGVAVIEVPYVKDLLDHVEFDTIYHEHLCYFSCTALENLFRRHGLAIVDVERCAIHGGSLRVTVGHESSGTPRASVGHLLNAEQSWQVGELAAYAGFRDRVLQLREELVGLLQDLKSSQRRIAAYGASAKGSTLLNYFGIGGELIDFVVDRSTIKQGHYTPGTHLKIYDPAKLVEEMPHYVLLLTWNFADEILAQQQDYLDRGGRFIIPIPEVRVA